MLNQFSRTELLIGKEGMETLYSRTLQIQFIETVAVEIFNIQRSDVP